MKLRVEQTRIWQHNSLTVRLPETKKSTSERDSSGYLVVRCGSSPFFEMRRLCILIVQVSFSCLTTVCPQLTCSRRRVSNASKVLASMLATADGDSVNGTNTDDERPIELVLSGASDFRLIDVVRLNFDKARLFLLTDHATTARSCALRAAMSNRETCQRSRGRPTMKTQTLSDRQCQMLMTGPLLCPDKSFRC